MNFNNNKLLIFGVAFLISLLISTLIIRYGIVWLKSKNKTLGSSDKQLNKCLFYDLGFWIGFFEMLIIFVFVINKEFSGLALIFGAKEFVRKEEIKKDPTYFLLGTVINFAISLITIELALFFF